MFNEFDIVKLKNMKAIGVVISADLFNSAAKPEELVVYWGGIVSPLTSALSTREYVVVGQMEPCYERHTVDRMLAEIQASFSDNQD